MGLFYDNSVESVKFVVEIKKQGSTAYAYYTYLRYKGMIAAGGRPGSYFGLTLRLDKYYQDTIHIYNLLEIVFKRYIVGTLLIPAGDSYKYAVPDFSMKAPEIGQMQQALIQLIQTTCTPSKFLNIDGSSINPISAAPSANIADVSEGAILATLKKYSKIVLSAEYETNTIKDLKNKLKEAEGKGGNLVAAKDKIIAEKDSTINSLNTTIATQQNKISVLEQENKRKDAEIQQFKKTGDLAQLAAKLKEPIYTLAEYFRIKEPRQQEPNYGRKSLRVGIIGCSIMAVVLVLCVISLLKSPQGGCSNEDLKNLRDQVAKLSKDNKQFEEEIKKKEQTIKDLQAELNAQTPKPSPSPQPAPTSITLRIDVAKYKSGKLSSTKEYVITAMDKNKKYSGDGQWSLENADIKRGKDTDAQITIQPNGKGKVKLEYKANDTHCQCDARTFEVESGQPQTSTGNSRGEQPATVNFSIVVEPNTEEVEIGKNYTFSISGYEGKGIWGVDGFSSPDDKNASSITVTAIEKGNQKAIISYTPEGGQKKVESYNYKKEGK